MWGTLGIVYNPQEVSAQEVSDWNILRNTDYKKRITAKDSVRDCYFAAASMICQDEVSSEEFRARSDYEQALSDKINDTSTETVEQIEEILTEVKENAFSFETDSGKADLVTGKVIANLQWSGDAVYSMQQAAEDGMTLKYAVPEACTNLWFDGWCMLKKGINGDTKKQQAAEAFINYLSKPESAIRNMYYIGYTSAIAGGDSDLIYEYLDWCYGTEDEDAVEYPLGYFFSGDQADGDYVLLTEEEQLDGELFAQYPTMDVINRSVVMAYFEPEANARISQMWINVRCYEFPFINK
jgi:spermidine/putrescine transport system substrate-binding protein